MSSRQPDLGSNPDRRRLFAAAALLAFAPSRAFAQRTISHIVVGFSAGGAADGLARLLAEKLRGTITSTVIVENRVGAASIIAADYVRAAPADGTAMLLAPDGVMFLYPHVYKSLNYEPERDFTPVTRLANMTLVMFAGPAVPANIKNLSDYLAWAKADDKRLMYGTPAAGAAPHFLGAMVARAAGLDMQPVHYKGGAPAIQELVGGQIPVMFGSVSDGLATVNAGKARALAVSSGERTAILPAVPTFRELGYPDLVIKVGLGTYVPSKTPRNVVEKLNSAMQDALQTEELKTAIRQWGFDVSREGPADFAARIAKERKRWAGIVQSTGFVAMD